MGKHGRDDISRNGHRETSGIVACDPMLDVLWRSTLSKCHTVTHVSHSPLHIIHLNRPSYACASIARLEITHAITVLLTEHNQTVHFATVNYVIAGISRIDVYPGSLIYMITRTIRNAAIVYNRVIRNVAALSAKSATKGWHAGGHDFTTSSTLQYKSTPSDLSVWLRIAFLSIAQPMPSFSVVQFA